MIVRRLVVVNVAGQHRSTPRPPSCLVSIGGGLLSDRRLSCWLGRSTAGQLDPMSHSAEGITSSSLPPHLPTSTPQLRPDSTADESSRQTEQQCTDNQPTNRDSHASIIHRQPW